MANSLHTSGPAVMWLNRDLVNISSAQILDTERGPEPYSSGHPKALGVVTYTVLTLSYI